MRSLPGLTPQVGPARLALALQSETRASPSFGAIHPSSKRWTPGSSPGVTRGGADESELLLEVLRRRVVARIDRILQELVLLIGPELAHIGIGLDHRVDVTPVLLLDLADIDVADDVAEVVERGWAGVSALSPLAAPS